jgi:hypothetical protein
MTPGQVVSARLLPQLEAPPGDVEAEAETEAATL